jgi:plastocyanin
MVAQRFVTYAKAPKNELFVPSLSLVNSTCIVIDSTLLLRRRIMVHQIPGFALAVALLVATLLTSCAGVRGPAVRPTEDGLVVIRAENYRFTPDLIEVETGTPVILHVANITGTTHNITIEDPEGLVLIDHDLPARSALSIELNLERPGAYPFYCDKPLHPTLGMRGRIVAR